MESMNLKRMAAEAAVERVKEGMVLGLGTGSTTRYAIEKLGRLMNESLNILCIPTSDATAELARSLGIPLTSLSEHPAVDLTIDGADEVDPRLNLIKGMGGALFREKLVALSSTQMIVIVDESKLVDFLGQRTPVPTEVLPFAWKQTRRRLGELGCTPSLREVGDQPFITDNGNYVLDCRFPHIEEASDLAEGIKAIPGVMEHGLFLDMADTVLVGRSQGITEIRRP